MTTFQDSTTRSSLHSSATPEHFTPVNIVESARQALEVIDLDPATTHLANTKNIKASRFFTKADDGLAHPWFGRVFLNPPGGVNERGNSNARLFWEKLLHDYLFGAVDMAVFVGYSLSIIQTAQSGGKTSPVSFPTCFFEDRICFLKEKQVGELSDGDGGYQLCVFEASKDPTHGNFVTFLPRKNIEDWTKDVARFHASFAKFGKVVVPYLPNPR